MLASAYDEGIIIHDKASLRDNEDGYYIDLGKEKLILLNKHIRTTVRRRVRLGEELGHHYTTVGDITDQTKIENRKQERQARAWGYKKLVSIEKLIKALNDRIQTLQELSEYLEVPEEFIIDSVKYYKEKYGLYCEFKGYILWLEPLKLQRKFNV